MNYDDVDDDDDDDVGANQPQALPVFPA